MVDATAEQDSAPRNARWALRQPDPNSAARGPFYMDDDRHGPEPVQPLGVPIWMRPAPFFVEALPVVFGLPP